MRDKLETREGAWIAFFEAVTPTWKAYEKARVDALMAFGVQKEAQQAYDEARADRRIAYRLQWETQEAYDKAYAAAWKIYKERLKEKKEMSKMSEELERRLDENKYELLEIIRLVVDRAVTGDSIDMAYAVKACQSVLTEIEGGK